MKQSREKIKAGILRQPIPLLRKVFQKPVKEQFFLFEVVFWLGITRLFLLLFPFKYIAPFLGKHMKESGDKEPPESVEESLLISSKIVSVSRRLPWECKCLVQAVAGKRILERRKVASTLYLGAGKNGEGTFAAHAWLRVGETIILGGDDTDRFAVMSTFA